MKKIIIYSLFSTVFSIGAIAQNSTRKSEEKIILQDNQSGNEVKIEIKDGNIFVDGKKVAPYALNRNLTIIKKLNNALGSMDSPDVELRIDKDLFGGDMAQTNKAMLGVSTEENQGNAGAKVRDVNANTPAAKAGIRSGDVITKIDKVTITSPQDLVNTINDYKPGDKVTVYLNRDGKEIEEKVTLEAKADNGVGGIFGDPNSDDMMENLQKMMRRFGDFGGNNPFDNMEEIGGNDNVKIFGNGIPSNNNMRIGAQLEERADGQGVRVVSVSPKSVADRAGISAEDIIVNFGGNPIKSLDDVSKALADTKDKKDIVVDVMRGGKLKTVYLQIEKPLRKKEF
jgi:serine protease Do